MSFKIKVAQRFISLFLVMVFLTFFQLFFTINVNANTGYNFPFTYGSNLLITQSCIDGYDSNSCVHSGYFSKKYAIDFACRPLGDATILSIFDGQVIDSGFDAYGYGNYVTILHTDGTVALYAHFKLPSNVTGYVKKGQQIGVCGTTGNSTGPHLHLELRPNRNTGNTIPIIFNECLTQTNCIKNQLKSGNTYISNNTPYISDISYDIDGINKTECIDEYNKKVSFGSNSFDLIIDCFEKNGLFYSNDRNDILVSNIKFEDYNFTQNNQSLCDQLINFPYYKIGQQNSTIYKLQECLIDMGYLKIAKPTYYFGVLTSQAIDKAIQSR